jgi:hypothetical protein
MINIEKYLFKPSDVMFKIIADMTNLLGLKFIVNEEKKKNLNGRKMLSV